MRRRIDELLVNIVGGRKAAALALQWIEISRI
jgi:hypothetical protein